MKEEADQENEDEIIYSEKRYEELETEMLHAKSLEEMKLRIQSRILIGGEEAGSVEVVAANEPDSNDPINLTDFQDSTHKDEVGNAESLTEDKMGSTESGISALVSEDIGNETSTANELNTKERLKARIDEKRKMKEGSGNQ